MCSDLKEGFNVTVVNMRQLSRTTKSVIEEVVRSGRPAIVTVNGRPQVAVTPLVGAVEVAEEHVLRDAPKHIRAAIREGEADLIGGRTSVMDDAVFTSLGEERGSDEVVATLEERLEAAGLRDAIRAGHDGTDRLRDVRHALTQVDVFALGRPAGDTSVPGQGTDSDLLHFTVDDEHGREVVMLPIFTAVETLRSALIRNEDWQSLYVLLISGRALLQNVDADVTIVIDPWSDAEFQIPPTGERTLVTDQPPIVAARDLIGAGA
jgi:prevent-host-death family protein